MDYLLEMSVWYVILRRLLVKWLLFWSVRLWLARWRLYGKGKLHRLIQNRLTITITVPRTSSLQRVRRWGDLIWDQLSYYYCQKVRRKWTCQGRKVLKWGNLYFSYFVFLVIRTSFAPCLETCRISTIN